jgi:hypothetical protein
MTALESPQLTAFSFEGLSIEKVIIHKIHPRSGSDLVPPKTSQKLSVFPQEALDTLQLRIQKALGNKSHGIEMSISLEAADSFFQKSASMLACSDQDFITKSQNLAVDLSKAQLSTNAPGGMLAVIRGRVGDKDNPFLAVIKADIQDGFRANEDDDNVNVEYISELLLTEAQRLYKIGLISPVHSRAPVNQLYSPSDYRAFLFDHLMTATETRNAAAYFYGNFLGMSIQASSKKLTQDFFEHTRSFIDTSPISTEQKLDLHEALRSDLKSQRATISVTDFSEKHLPSGLRESYSSYMESKSFPKNAVIKDNEYIKAKLKRRRKYVFTNGVWLSTPSESDENLLKIESLDEKGTTIVTINSRLESQK